MIAFHILIPGKLVRFLEHANVAFVGVRDRDRAFRTSRERVAVGADQRTMTILVPDEFLEKLLESLKENGELAITVEEFPSHGYINSRRYLRHRAVQEDDGEMVERVRRRFVKSLKPMYADAPKTF